MLENGESIFLRKNFKNEFTKRCADLVSQFIYVLFIIIIYYFMIST